MKICVRNSWIFMSRPCSSLGQNWDFGKIIKIISGVMEMVYIFMIHEFVMLYM